jgi:membrane protein
MQKLASDLLNPVEDFFKFLGYVWYRYRQDRCMDTAAALTYQTLFAVVPLLTVTYSVFSMFSSLGGLDERIEDFIFSHFIPTTGTIVQTYLHAFSEQARELTQAGILFLVVTAFLMLFTIERIFNQIWRVDEGRHGLQRFLLYWGILSLGPLLVGMAVIVSTYLLSLPLLSEVAATTSFLKWVPLLLNVGLFTLIYIAVPNCKVPFFHGLVGGLLVAILFEIAKNLFTRLVAMTSFEFIYGAFATVPLFLFWIFLVWTMILLGAELVRCMAVYRGSGRKNQDAHLLQILSVLEVFFRAHQGGEAVSETQLLKGRLSLENWQIYRKLLTDLNILSRLDSGDYILAKDLGEVTVWQLYRSLPWLLPDKAVKRGEHWQDLLYDRLEEVSRSNAETLDINIAWLFGNTTQGD